jgi:hypothetical protein
MENSKLVSNIARVCVSVFLPYLSYMQSACVALYCHLWCVCGSTLFSYRFHKSLDFRDKKYFTQNVCFSPYKFYLKLFPSKEEFSEILPQRAYFFL